MLETLEKFIKKLKTIDRYYLLRQEKEYIIVGTKIIIKEHVEIAENFSFQPFSTNIDKELPVFFYVIASKTILDFPTYNLPILSLNNQKNINNLEGIKSTLDNYVKNTF